jgi:predicted RNA-binding protein YlxR (DUF448 family)
MKTRKIPMRMCVGCREMKEKKSLVRVVRTTEGEIRMDPTGKANGRGAYVCPDPACLEKAVRQKQLERALEARIDESVLARLQEAVRDHQ